MSPAEQPASIGLAALARMAFEGVDQQPLWDRLVQRASAEGGDPAALMDLATMLLLNGQTENGLGVQAQALGQQRVYRRPSPGPAELRLLAIMAPGDMMANTPLDFLLEGSNIELTSLYVDASGALPDPVPDHDLAFLAIGESEANQSRLQALAGRLAKWPQPLLNADALGIAGLTRDGACRLLEGAPGILAPSAVRLDREGLATLASGAKAFPVIARPIGSHAGAGLSKLDDAGQVLAYLAEQPAERFYVQPFVDYSGPDGLYRKHRIVVIEGRPFVCHMAVSPRWMVHYLNADMLENPTNRAEEARFMAEFDADFAVRHQAAFAALHERLGLDYFGIDSGETPDGRLLVFEVDVAMIVHDMDPPDLFPYKKPQMRKVFDAFQAMLRRRAGR